MASAVVSAGVAVIGGLTWRSRGVAGSGSLAGLMLAVTVWALAKVLELVSVGLSTTLFWSDVQYAGIVVLPTAWLVFTLRYTGRDAWVTRRTLLALSVEPVLVLVLLWTNDAHGLFRTSVVLVTRGAFTGLTGTLGPVFWVHTAYSYLLLVGGTWLVVRMAILSDHLFRGQAVGLLAAVLVPWVANGLYVAGLVPADVDLTITAFTVTGSIFLWVISRHRLLELVPVAREVARNDLIEHMSDAVVVVDAEGRVVDATPAARGVLGGEPSAVIGRPLEDVSPPIAAAVDSAATGDESFRTEYEHWDGSAFHSHDVRVSLLSRGRGLLAGRLISLRDVTKQRHDEQQLYVLYRVLRHNLRNGLNVIGGNASLLGDAEDRTERRRRAETVERTVEKMLERSEKMRAVVGSDPERGGPVDVAAELSALVAAKRGESPDADITLDCVDRVWAAAGPSVVTAIDEVVTNAIEHQECAHPRVRVSARTGRWTDRASVQIRVADDGPGLSEHEVNPIVEGRETPLDHGSGVGLWVVTWLVREAGGDLAFPETDDGTTVAIHLPRGEPGERERTAT